MTTFLACIGSFVLGLMADEWASRKLRRIAVAALAKTKVEAR